MAKSNQQMIFEVNGDVTGLRRALAQGTNSIQQFGTESGEIFGETTEKLTGLVEKFSGFNTGLVGTAAAAGLAAGGIYSLISSSNEYVKTYNEISTATGVSVSMLQKLEKQFASSGITIERWGDINKDSLDHLGDSFRAGGGISDDLKQWGIYLQQYNKYLNQTDGGIKAVIHTFYEMQKAGKSNAEIVNVMESLASDSSHLISTLKDYSNEQDALNAIQSQHATLTDETALKYQEFDQKVSQLSSSFQLFKAEALAPTLDDIQTLFDWMNKDWSKTDFMSMFRNFYYGGDNTIAKALRWMDGVDASTISGTKEFDQAKADNNYPPKPTATTSTAPSGGWVDTGKQEAAAKAAAAKAEAAAKQAAAKRLQAEQTLQQSLSQIGMSEGAIRITQFNYQQDEIVKKIKDSASTLHLTEAQTTTYLSQAYDSRTKKFKAMIDEMLSVSDPKQLSENVAAIGDNLTKADATKLLGKQDQRLSIGAGNDEANPFNNGNVLSGQKAQLQQGMQSELTLNAQLNEKLGTSHEQYMQRKAEITSKYNQKILALETQNTTSQMTMLADSAGSIGTIMSGVFGEGSKASKAFFAVQKGITIANTVMKIQEALATALATPFPANIANYASILGMGASIISTVKGAASGQAHSGIDSVPTIGGKDESTWILQAGERVLSKNNNRDLTSFLSNQNNNKSTDNGSSNVINAPLVVQGDSVDDDAKFQALLKKHSSSVFQAVRNAQQRSS